MTNSPRIIIVDDDEEVRTVVSAITRESMPSAAISEHASALCALHEVNSGVAELLITNCDMPDMNGPTLVQTIRKTHNPIPIIMVSGSDEARELGTSAGIDRFVAKGQLHAELSEAIHALVDQ